MKRVISFILALFVCVCMMANKIGGKTLSATAKTTYGTSSGMSITGGTIDWDPTTKTLTLNRAVVNTREVAIYIDEPTTILLNGGCALISADNLAIEIHANTVIKSATSVGNGSINVTAKKGDNAANVPAIRAYACSLDIEACTMNITSETLGALVSNGNSDAEVLNVRGADLTLKSGSTWTVMYNWAKVNLVGSEITVPKGAVYSDKDKGLFFGGEAVKGSASIRMKKYPVHVAGTQVTGRNMTDVTGDESVQFSESSGRYYIYLKNANINSSSSCIKVNSECNSPVILSVLGSCSLTSSSGNAIYADNNSTFTIEENEDNPELVCNAAFDDAIYVGSSVKEFTFKRVKNEFFKVDVVSDFGYALNVSDSGTKLGFNNSQVSFQSAEGYSAVLGVGKPTFTDAYVYGLNGEHFDSKEMVVVDGEGNTANSLEIHPGYGICLAGVDFTKYNLDAGTNGAVVYDPNANVLKVTKNYDAFNDGITALYISKTTLRIALTEGVKFNLYSSDAVPMVFNNANNITIEGSGIFDVRVDGKQSQYDGVVGWNTSMYLRDNVNFSARAGYGYAVKLDGGISIYHCDAFFGNNYDDELSPLSVRWLSLGSARFMKSNYAFSVSDGCVVDTDTGKPVIDDVSVIHVDKFDLYVDDVQVDEYSSFDITGEGISGKVWYDRDMNTLFLENATLQLSSGLICNEKGFDGFRIHLIGNNKIVVSNSGANSIFSQHNVKFTGQENASLSIVSNGKGVVVESDVSFYDCNVTIECKDECLYATESSPIYDMEDMYDYVGNLHMANTTLTLKSKDSTPFYGFSHYPSVGTISVSPAGLQLKTITTSSDRMAQYVDAKGSVAKQVSVKAKCTEDDVRRLIGKYLICDPCVTMKSVVDAVDKVVVGK